LKGLVYRSTGSWYEVKDVKGDFWKCRLKGKFKLDETIRSSNPIAVGDIVHFDIEDKTEETGMIYEIQNRTNYVARISPKNRNLRHMIASNLDQSLLVATLKNPKTSSGFIDRFLVSCETYHIPAIIAFNKSDIYGEEEMDRYTYLKYLYEKIGYRVLLISAKEKAEIKSLQELLEGKKTLISGHSGVGKSSLINVLMPEQDLKVMEVSDWSGKGMHTTTFAEMYDLNEDSKLIDTPGIRELGIVDIEREELSGYFPEMRARLQNCKFNNCLHLNEPDCAIQQAVIDGEIEEERFGNYMSILGSY
jgi:ribosome biogenesis GTPase